MKGYTYGLSRVIKQGLGYALNMVRLSVLSLKSANLTILRLAPVYLFTPLRNNDTIPALTSSF